MTPKSPPDISNSDCDWHPPPVISRDSGGATGGSRREPGHGNKRREQQMPLRSRMSTLFAALVVVAGSVFLFEYVLFVGHAVGGGLRHVEPGVASGLSPMTGDGTKRLGVVVPAFAGDLSKALNSLAYWPTTCYQSTLRRMDLILYYAGGAEDKVAELLPGLAETGGRCFARTRLVLGNLTDEENFYPRGPSVQFYKMFLDEKIRMQLSEYQVLALVEWDVIVAHESSFHKLYQAAFGGIEPFWVKGSTLEGVNFHETVVLPESRFVLGHINGNALYNNSDPTFVEFIEYTLKRWDYAHSYDVALWATIADLPYSWPLWQRFSRKFVATDLISNVGFLDVNHHTVGKAVASDTLFIHGSLTGGGGSMFKARAATDTSRALELLGKSMPSEKCTSACGSTASIPGERGMAAVCDRSCSPSEYGARFDGLNCGADDPAQFGENCRMCYEDEAEAKEEEERMIKRNAGSRPNSPQKHVILCETLLPPPSSACSTKCMKKADTVCDESCAMNRYDGYNCNWRGYGDNCRFCFHDRTAALKADAVAKARGGRVIMCHTYEPPMEEDVWKAPPPPFEDFAKDVGAEKAPEVAEEAVSKPEVVEEKPLTPEEEIYVGDIKRGQVCAFMVGYQRYVRETHVTAKSIAHFMPGIRIAIATPSDDVSVYERTLGYLPGVRVTPAIRPTQHSALLADRHCGKGTRVIYYMNPGELLSRAFTSKDTHSVKGDLLIVYAEVDRVGAYSVERTLATTSVLGFSSPSFSFGMDIMLPAEMNQQLRDVLLSDPKAGTSRGKPYSNNPEVRAVRAMDEFKGAFIPEILAALAYSRNPPGVWFINPQQWVTYHMFEPASIWDIPLVKPRFGCAFDLSMISQGYDVAAELDQQLGHFMHGGSCERGFIALDKDSLRPMPYFEFDGPAGREMPTMEGLTVSVVFNVEANVHPISLEISLTSVVERFPDAAEAVVIFNQPPVFEKQVMEVINDHNERSSFPVFAVKTPASKEKHPGDDWDWSGLHAEEYCSGMFVLNMEPGDVLTTNIAYNNIFHFRKPVIPFNRLTKLATDTPHPIDKCTVEAVAFALGKPTDHNFALLRSLVYPREAYKNLRRFVEQEYSTDIETVVNHGRTSCKPPMKAIGKSEPSILVPRAHYEMNLLGSFMWHNMHDTVHWRALHVSDIQPDEWPTDVGNYNFYCDLRGFGIPGDGDLAKRFVEAAREVDSQSACSSFSKLMDGGV